MSDSTEQNGQDLSAENSEGTTAGGVKIAVDGPKQEVTAATIGRMMGLATVSDLRLLDSKIDLAATRITGISTKMEKALTMLNSAPTAADLERIEVQIGALKTTMKEAVSSIEESLEAFAKTAKALQTALKAQPSDK